MAHPDQLPSIPVRATIEQMYEGPEFFRLWIRNLTITDSDQMTVEHLAYLVQAFPRLRTLNLWHYRGDNIEPLGGLRYIQTLNLWSYQGGLEPLRRLHNLQALGLANYQGDNIEPLRDLVNLRALGLNSYKGGLEPLRGLHNLRELYLEYYPDQEAVRALKRELGI